MESSAPIDIKPHCRKCLSEQTILIDTSEGCIHSKKMICAECDSFIKWVSVKTPFNEEYGPIIDELIKIPTLLDLTTWELNFLTSIKFNIRLTPKQKARFDKILEKHNK